MSRVLASVADTLDAHKDELTQLDMPIGDSDHGINMARGFDAVRDLLPELAGKDAPAVLKKAGMTVISKVGGSSGPLYGTILRKLGVAVKRAKGLTLASFADGLEAGFAGIQDLAGAQLGDKTMLDAMRPAHRQEGARELSGRALRRSQGPGCGIVRLLHGGCRGSGQAG